MDLRLWQLTLRLLQDSVKIEEFECILRLWETTLRLWQMTLRLWQKVLRVPKNPDFWVHPYPENGVLGYTGVPCKIFALGFMQPDSRSRDTSTLGNDTSTFRRGGWGLGRQFPSSLPDGSLSSGLAVFLARFMLKLVTLCSLVPSAWQRAAKTTSPGCRSHLHHMLGGGCGGTFSCAWGDTFLRMAVCLYSRVHA